jgi:Peptidase family M20/M25/M40
MPNMVGSFDCADPGRHLALNGHIDVFPVANDGAGWSGDPWGGQIVDGQIVDGKICGRGVADMKAGTTASIFNGGPSSPFSVRFGEKGSPGRDRRRSCHDGSRHGPPRRQYR